MKVLQSAVKHIWKCKYLKHVGENSLKYERTKEQPSNMLEVSKKHLGNIVAVHFMPALVKSHAIYKAHLITTKKKETL